MVQLSSQSLLTEEDILHTLSRGLEHQFTNKKVLCLIPDHTRTLPLPFLFRTLVDVLHDTAKLDFMVALGTHPPLTEEQLLNLVGVSSEEKNMRYKHIGLLNHAWDDANTLTSIGTIKESKVREFAENAWHETLAGDVDIRINKAVLEYDHILILGPTFPHEVAGFSGGAKYLFPGISGPEMINKTHWLGALVGIVGTIGVAETPVRAMIHEAANVIPTPVTLIALVVEGKGLAGMFIGNVEEAWREAAKLSGTRHILWLDKPVKRVLSCAPAMYDELWTAGKAMYKLEPALAKGAELIIYAPHLDTVSHIHGKYIHEIGYHVLAYFTKQWDKFKHIPLGVLAHSTHVRGGGTFDDAEHPNFTVTLASKIPEQVCKHMNLGYMNPNDIDIAAWQNKTDEDSLYVSKAGEMLYRVKS
ncbi:MAG: lactate racemase domain-containing protein [Trueperaceae bacterium]